MTEKVTPSQRARDAAASTYNPSFHPGIKRETELGDRDDCLVVQAFARFEREVAQETEQRALERAAQAAYTWWDGEPEDAEDLRQHIRSLSPAPESTEQGVREADPSRERASRDEGIRVGRLQERKEWEAAVGFERDGACPICGGIEGCSHSLRERVLAALSPDDIRREERKRARQIALDHATLADATFLAWQERVKSGAAGMDIAGGCAIGLAHQARVIAAAIGAETGK